MKKCIMKFIKVLIIGVFGLLLALLIVSAILSVSGLHNSWPYPVR